MWYIKADTAEMLDKQPISIRLAKGSFSFIIVF